MSSSLEQQNQRENQLRRRRKPSTSKHRSYQEIFPGVYTLKLPIFELQNSQEMISDMDLLHIECNRIPLTKADSNNNTDCTMHTLIHSHQELEYLKNVLAHGALSQHQPDLLFDFNSTQALLQTSSKNNSERRTETEHASTNQYPTILGFDCFVNMQGMHAWLREFASTAPPHLDVSLTDIGDSYNKTQDSNYGYDIYALKITAAAVSSISKKSPLMILTGVHPREYSPPETVRQWIQQFLDPDNTYLQTILQTTEIHWVPYVNPDGRHYAETKQPYRRKNLNRNAPGSEFCNADEYGVDINRNFPFRWGLSSGSSIRACSQTYRGASAGSEPETQAVMNYALSVFPGEQRKAYDDFHLNNPVAYNEETARGVFIDIHAYGNYYIWVRGFVSICLLLSSEDHY